MSDERQFIQQIEEADPATFARLLIGVTPQRERALHTFFGSTLYQHLRGLAIRWNKGGGRKGTPIVVVPGMFGSTLLVEAGEQDEHVWLNPIAIARGELDRMRQGSSSFQVHANGLLKRNYGMLLMTLLQHGPVHAFSYDWRLDIRESARALGKWIEQIDGPFIMVAHSQGALVAQAWLSGAPQRQPERLITIGAPWMGGVAIAQLLGGTSHLLKMLSGIDARLTPAQIGEMLRGFPGIVQMMPNDIDPALLGWPLTAAQREALDAMGALRLAGLTFPPERLFEFRGGMKPTPVALTGPNVASFDAFRWLLQGDGLTTTGDVRGPVAYLMADHLELAGHPGVLEGIDELLAGQQPTKLRMEPKLTNAEYLWIQRSLKSAIDGLEQPLPAADALKPWLGSDDAPTDMSDVLEQHIARVLVELREREAQRRLVELREAFEKSRGLIAQRGGSVPLTEAERGVELSMTRHAGRAVDDLLGRNVPEAPFDPPTITIRLLNGRIERFEPDQADGPAALAVGHFLGMRPTSATLDLDWAISPESVDSVDALLLTQFADRRILPGGVGQLFTLPDPRSPSRVIAVVGLGMPGYLKAMDLSEAVRELCWTLGRMGVRHLAAILIGARSIPGSIGAMSLEETARAWVRGIKFALTGEADQSRCIQTITFVDSDPIGIQEIDALLAEEMAYNKQQRRFIINYTPFTAEQKAELNTISLRRRRLKSMREQLNIDLELLSTLPEAEREQQALQIHAQMAQVIKQLDLSRSQMMSEVQVMAQAMRSLRISCVRAAGVYRFAALTDSAAISETDNDVDPELVQQTSTQLVNVGQAREQVEQGYYLAQLMGWQKLGAQINVNAPLVMMLDSTTARLPWELIVNSERVPEGDGSDQLDCFLGIGRSLTRQFITSMGRPGEPPPPAMRRIRVLVVADPAEDARLPGAEVEGIEVADLFESCNAVFEQLNNPNRIEVRRLFGPYEATRNIVLQELNRRTYDVLHFAGHCIYDAEQPERSGWVFSNNARLTGRDLKVLERIPKFIFSNACESGITPDRGTIEGASQAPSFAEMLFALGVSNIICTAWPVDDGAALDFALTFYRQLLGLGERSTKDAFQPAAMYEAMRAARTAAARHRLGAKTWAAYQHYGDPHFRLFSPERRSATPTPHEGGKRGL